MFYYFWQLPSLFFPHICLFLSQSLSSVLYIYIFFALHILVIGKAGSSDLYAGVGKVEVGGSWPGTNSKSSFLHGARPIFLGLLGTVGGACKRPFNCRLPRGSWRLCPVSLVFGLYSCECTYPAQMLVSTGFRARQVIWRRKFLRLCLTQVLFFWKTWRHRLIAEGRWQLNSGGSEVV